MFWETTGTRTESPIEMYVDWKKGKDWDNKGVYGFYSWSKDLGEIKIDLKQFIIIDEAYQLVGYNNKLSKYLRSNIITNKKKEEFIVSNDGTEIYKGIYDPEVKPQWAKLMKVLTILEWDNLVRLNLWPAAAKSFTYIFAKEIDDKGGVSEWREYSDRYKYIVDVTWEETKESSFGEYSIPTFAIGKELTVAMIKKATIKKDIFKEYIESFTKKESDDIDDLFQED